MTKYSIRAVCAALFLANIVNAADWPTFAHDPQRSGWAREEFTLSAQTVTDLELKWKTRVNNKPKALAFLELLDKELAEREFAAGDDFSVADITGLVAMDFMKPARITLPEHLTNVSRWYQALRSRPSASA